MSSDTENSEKPQIKHSIELEIKKRQFVSLHTHGPYSLLDGVGPIDEYIKLAKEYNHPAMALTDHGVVSGTFDFWKKCKAGGIKPIIGMEAYVNDKMGEFEEKKEEGGNYHQIILVKNEQGYKNLNRLVYLSFTEGYYKRGRIKTDWLIENKEGLFITTSCLASVMARNVVAGKLQIAEDYLAKLVKEFGDNIAVEIQFNEADEQKIYNAWLIRMARKYNLLTIVTNDIHYAAKDGAKLQDTLIAIQQKGSLATSFKLSTRSLYYPNAEDIHRFNKIYGYNYPEDVIDRWIANTLIVADKCNFDFDTKTEKYPKYEASPDVIDYFKSKDVEQIIGKLSRVKLQRKLNEYKKNGIVKMTPEKEKEYHDRLTYELKVIKEKHALDYFMIYWELIREYKKSGNIIGPGRGCFLGDNQVKMADGKFKEIQEIQPGEFVMDAFGQPQKVLKTFEYDASENILHLEFDNGTEANPTLDHEYHTQRGWVKAGELNLEDEIVEV